MKRLRLLTAAFFLLIIIAGIKAESNGRTDEKCFDNSRKIERVSGHIEKKFSPKTAPDKTFDARQAEFLIKNVKWGMITIKGSDRDRGMCWVGGFVHSSKPWDASWADHKDLDGPTRNSAAINCAAAGMTISGVHYFNVEDGVRTSDAVSWQIEHNWGEYIRDDCVENDHLRSGRIYDCLFDGCYTGISTRPLKNDAVTDGSGALVELDRVLIRLQPMPYPYKWESKKGVIDEDGNPYSGNGIPYGHSYFFKMTSPNRNPHYSIKNCVFLAAYLTSAEKFDFPPAELMDACENNIIIWLGPGDYPGKLPVRKFPAAFKIVTGQKGHELWKEKVSDWHARHPDVGTQRKQKSPGELSFPKKF